MAAIGQFGPQVIVDTEGRPIPSSVVKVVNTANVPTVLYSDINGTNLISQVSSDNSGNLTFWAAPGTYTVIPPGGIPFNVPVASVTSGSTTWVSVATFGAKGDGVSDDTSAIQATINSLGSGGGTVYFPPGTYLISSTLTVSNDNVQLIGSGWGSQIKANGAWAAGTYMIQVTGPGGAGNFRYGIKIADLHFNGNNIAGVNGIDMISTYGAVIEHLRIRFVLGISIYMDGINTAFGAYNQVKDCLIADGGTAGVGLKTNFSEWLTIKGGNFVNFRGGTGVAVYLTNLNCRIIGTGFDFNDIGVRVDFASRTIISGCQFDRGSTNFIWLRGSANCTVVGNAFSTASGGTDQIFVTDAGNSANQIVGNTCLAGTTWTNFVNEHSSATNVTAPNQYVSNDTAGLGILRATNAGIFRSNRGYNPRGSIAPPVVPASTVAQTNNLGADCMVLVSGGTVSNVAVGGTATGQTSGWFRVPALQTITLTYTVAPTWQWFGD